MNRLRISNKTIGINAEMQQPRPVLLSSMDQDVGSVQLAEVPSRSRINLVWLVWVNLDSVRQYGSEEHGFETG